MTEPLPRRIAWFAPWTWKRRWIILAGLLMVGYPLSMGPAWGMLRCRLISSAMFKTAYAPLIWLTKNDTFYWWAIWYINFFDWR